MLSPLPATKPGGTLEYSVTLANQSPYGKPINLVGMCPNYTERLYLPDRRAIETHFAPNCQPAGWLAGGPSVTFAMT